jgi:hypothetical protein
MVLDVCEQSIKAMQHEPCLIEKIGPGQISMTAIIHATIAAITIGGGFQDFIIPGSDFEAQNWIYHC